MAIIVGAGRLQIPDHRGLGETARRLVVQGGRRGRGRQQDNVYVFNRGEHPMMVFDRDGNFLRSWGEGQYPRAHGVHMGPDDSIYLTDDGGHFVRKCCARRQGVAGARRSRQARALYERRAVPPLHPHRARRRRARSTSRTATATPRSTNIRPTANC